MVNVQRKWKMENARNASYYFEAEENCKNENSVLVSTFEPEFSPNHLGKLKEVTQYNIRSSY